jgi:arylsulfatase A-like enzyme
MRLALLALLPLAQDVAPRPPNVVIFLADDAGWGDYGHNGNLSVRTPHIDSLARDGARFSRFFVCAVCAPTRAEFLTGRYHARGGVRGVSSGQERLDPGEKTLADAFKAAGYATGAFGKWHNGSQWPYHPRARGFDEYYGHTSGHWGEYVDPPLEHDGRMRREKGYIVDLCVDRALDFVERNQAKPFLCYVPFTTPHSPWRAPDEDWARWKDKAIAQPLPKEKTDETRSALAMIENQDRNVGRVLAKLDDLRLRDGTIVLFFSDNGPNGTRWNGGMKGRKGSIDEGGIRSPLLVRWPGKIAPGTEIGGVAGAIDLLPTLTALAGVPRAGGKPLDGLDLSPQLLGRGAEIPERMIFHQQNQSFGVRSSRYRLDAKGALFDMVDDPGQTRNIAGEKKDVAARLSKALEAWRRELGPLPPDDRPFPVGYREFPISPLPARDGVPRGGVKRSSSAPNCSYFVNWRSTDDAITWDVEVATAGEYEVTLDYTCPLADAGATIELSLGESKLSGRVEPGWDPPLFDNQDNIERPAGESRMKEFRPLELGTIRLAKGRGRLTLRATRVPGASVMDLRRLTLTLRP